MEDLIFGRNPVLEALKSGRPLDKILVLTGAGGSIEPILTLARQQGIPIQRSSRQQMDRLTGKASHQGVIAFGAAKDYVDVEEFLTIARNRREPPSILALDHLEDPQNFGAVLRVAEASGVHGVVIPKRRSVSLSATVAKSSAGALEHIAVARVTNLVRTLEYFKKEGLWITGLDAAGSSNYFDMDWRGPVVIVVGSEGRGLSRLVKDTCDFLVKIPMLGRLNSLNAAVAASLVLYELVRQRHFSS
ncbi:MAG: 23S rRNA (guanosine(2251)-2'-O)-methyltransferase RlmB [Clostridia bacterium]|nr:23S rRNA (guanosine(2251)-2'-O)-methyltransferase RlmB [Clostridia bacterium]